MTNKFHHIVITAGISLFAKQNVYGKWVHDDLKGIFTFSGSNPEPAQGCTEETSRKLWEEACKNRPEISESDFSKRFTRTGCVSGKISKS